MMCGENEPDIVVFRFDNNGMGGPTQDTIEGVLDDVRAELEGYIQDGDSEPITLTVTTARMKQSVYDELPEFEGY